MFTYTAQEAYDKAMTNYNKWLEENREYLDGLIKEAVDNCGFKVIYDREQSQGTKILLNQLGYNVKDFNGKWVVSWEDPGNIQG